MNWRILPLLVIIAAAFVWLAVPENDMASVPDIASKVASLQQAMDAAESRSAALKGQLTALRDQVAALTAEVGTLRGQVPDPAQLEQIAVAVDARERAHSDELMKMMIGVKEGIARIEAKVDTAAAATHTRTSNMPPAYEKMKDQFKKKGMTDSAAKTKAAKIFNARRKKGTPPITRRTK